MQHLRKPVAVIALISLAVTSVLWLGSGEALACDCASPDLIDAVASAEVVFAGTIGDNVGSRSEPIWQFDVASVIKGDVGSQETVRGADQDCGPTLRGISGDLVVYAEETDRGLKVKTCFPVPTVAAFSKLLDEAQHPSAVSGSGKPAAVMLGRYHNSDFAVIDDQGQTIARGAVGLESGTVAHCAGTTAAAVVSNDADATLSFIDLTTISVTEQRTFVQGRTTFGLDRVTCLNQGAIVVATSGWGPEAGMVEVASNTAMDGRASGIARTLDYVTSAVAHQDGTVFVLPLVVGAPVQTLDAVDLEPIDNGLYELPSDASTMDGDVSPDGSKLAVLATLDGREIEWDGGATHILVIELENGLPTNQPAQVIELVDPGHDIFTNKIGAARRIRWIDDSTWVIESETTTSKRLRIVALDGTQTVDNVYAGWGWGLAPIPAGVLRAKNGGLEVLTADGTMLRGDPAPVWGTSRSLQVAPLIDAPDFVPTASSVFDIEIRPVAAGTPSPRPAQGSGRNWLLPVAGVAVAGATGFLLWWGVLTPRTFGRASSVQET